MGMDILTDFDMHENDPIIEEKDKKNLENYRVFEMS